MKTVQTVLIKKLEAEIEKLKIETAVLGIKESPDGVKEKKLLTDKLELEIKKIQHEIKEIESSEEKKEAEKEREHRKFLIGILAPFISAMALIGTLFFQYNNSREDKILKRQADEDTQWRSFLSIVSDTNITLPAAILNRSFFKSEKYKNPALEIAGNVYLPLAKDEKYFSIIFREFANAIDTSNYRTLVNLSENIYKQIGQTKYSSLNDAVLTPDRDSAILFNEKINELRLVNESLIRFITQFDKTHPGQHLSLNLAGASFYKINMGSVPFGNAKIDNCVFDNCDFLFAHLLNVRSANNSRWPGSAWWRSIDISDFVLYDIIPDYPFEVNKKYFDIYLGKADQASPDNDERQYSKYVQQYEKFKKFKKRADEL